MVTINDIVQIELSKNEVLSCLGKTRQNRFIDNLRYRPRSVQFDCKLRGYVGEVAIKNWFEQHGIIVDATDYLEDGDSIDIDFLVKGKNIELKTSLIPDYDGNLTNVIANRDIKLIRRGAVSIEQLQGDVHLQIYYTPKRLERDNWLKSRRFDLSGTDEELYHAFQANNYQTAFFVAWMDKPALIQKINSLPTDKRTWGYALRDFWNCKLYQSKKPLELIDYLNSLG